MGEIRLRVFQNRTLRRISEPKRNESGEWRTLHKEELHSLYRSLNIVMVIKFRRLRWAGHVARMEDSNGAFTILIDYLTGNITFGRPRCRWEDGIRKDVEEIDINTRNCVDSAQERGYWRVLVIVVLNLRVI